MNSPSNAVTAPHRDISPAAFRDGSVLPAAPSLARIVRSRLLSGELGSTPAVLGLVILGVVFTVASPQFLSLANLANLLAQSAGVMIIAMGLVFVLLTGEIDVSAGTASGVTAAVLALHYNEGGNLLRGMGSSIFYAFIALLVVAAALGAYMRLWAASAFPIAAAVLALAGLHANPWVEMVLAVCVGTAIGLITGFLVAWVRIPSFVITLALFLTWQGVILKLVGGAGVLGISTSPVLDAVANGNLRVLGSWILYGVGAGGYAAVSLLRCLRRARAGMVGPPLLVVSVKVGLVLVGGAVGTALLSANRSRSGNSTIAGVPYVVPIVLALLIGGSYVLARTSFGRHVYAVGGNSEAARRAGIQVRKIRASVFVLSSSCAALGAIVYSSKVGSVDPTAGGLNTLLFAVGAAVIGGTSLFGGRGRISDAVIGGLVVGVVGNGLGLLSQPAATVEVVTGLVLALAATVDALSRRRMVST